MTNERNGERDLVVIVTGPVGAGKTTTMWALGDLLSARHIPHAVLDVDQVRTYYPAPASDRFGERVGLRNVEAVAANYRAEGARVLVLATVIETRESVTRFERAIPGAQITVVRLTVPMATMLERLDKRESASTIEWYRNRAPELQGIMERANIGDIIVDVGHRPPEAVASEIADRLCLLHIPDPPSS